MEESELRRVGRLGKPWGHLGDLNLRLDGSDPEDLGASGTLFVDIEGQRVPFYFTKVQEKGRGVVLIKFDDIDDPQTAAVLVGRDIYAAPGLLADGSDESWDPDDLVGVLVTDTVHGELGEIVRIEGNTRNPIMVVLRGEREVLVPLTDDWIEEVDLEQGTLRVRTPPGLLDLNRGDTE
ncbi:MAG: 16S rRNA processing protein RimM [Flavobacteriales bacterium]|nr:16S rRNA processing protein RimM [Flavobacteriales bacterium]MCB9168576.1 16S rRNA processing protein RimM [Flavobacteriales bacterium]